MYTSWAKGNGGNTIVGGLTPTNSQSNNTMGNGLLPNFLSFTGSTRQNDLDVSWTISLQPGSANNAALQQVGSANNTQGGLNNRQSFITVGDKSWGSFKIGKDLGIFSSDAILNDMTLLGVGAGSAGSAGNTSLGRIGAGYIYADWKPQISYTTPNMSGFQATVGITKAFAVSSYDTSAAESLVTYNGNISSSGSNAQVAYEGKASYSFGANDVTGKVWVSGLAQHVNNLVYTASFTSGFLPGTTLVLPGSGLGGNDDSMAYVGDIGANVKMAGFDLTGYYYSGTGVGTTGQMLNGYGVKAGDPSRISGRDSDGGYVQVKYALPTKTTVGVSWGISHLDLADGERNDTAGKQALVKENEMWDLMLVHPLTKHLNLVAEYSYQESSNQGGQKNDANVGSLGAILFF